MQYLTSWLSCSHCYASPLWSVTKYTEHTHTDHRQDTFNRANGFLMKNSTVRRRLQWQMKKKNGKIEYRKRKKTKIP